MNSIDDLSDDPNQRVAPWFGRMTVEQQNVGLMLDFKNRLRSLDEHFKSDLFSDTFINIFCGTTTEGYRNKNKFSFGYSADLIRFGDSDLQKYLKLGFIGGAYPTNYIIDSTNACTINDQFKLICQIVETIVKQSNLKAFLAPPRLKQRGKNRIYLKHEGVWRYLTIRHSLKENRYMVTLTNFIRYIDDSNRSEYQNVLNQISDRLFGLDVVKSFNLHEYQKTLEPQPDDLIKNIFNKDVNTNPDPVLYEELLGKTFSISPNSFFQVNTEATTILYSKIRDMFKYMIDQTKKNILIDMYCGTGTIGITLADLFDHVIGIDEVAVSIENAKLNVKLNDLNNFSFITGRCENSLDEIERLCNHFGDNDNVNLYLVVDPAREGLHKRVRKFIRNMNCYGFVYCSCNANSWMSDVKDIMSSNSYVPLQTLIVNLFPHTQHYEVLSCFKYSDK